MNVRDPAAAIFLAAAAKLGNFSAMQGSSKSNVLLATARRDFSWFYLNGTPHERQLMDMLVLTTSLVVTLRDEPAAAASDRDDRQETRAAAEHAFVELRAKIRGCAIFAVLPVLERRAIQRVLFDRGPAEP
jgi:hypothetical protein